MSDKNGKKINIKTIVLIVLAAAVIIGMLTGRFSLSDLFGSGEQTSAVTESAAASTEADTEGAASSAEAADTEGPSDLSLTHAATIETITIPADIVPTKTTAAETTKEEDGSYVEYKFRNNSLLTQHYDKHGKEMGFASAQEYQKAASDIINDPNVMHKYKTDGSGDQCFYVEATKEFVVLSYDGYIRTYFICSGINYYNRQ